MFLNGMLTLDDHEAEEPCCVLQPGWDEIEQPDPPYEQDQE